MNLQMSAERTRRAAVTEAEGKRQASVTVAEGEKQTAILCAEAENQSSILNARGCAQARQAVYSAAQHVDSKTMTLQVIDGLKAIASSPTSTFVRPMEFTRLSGRTAVTWSGSACQPATASPGCPDLVGLEWIVSCVASATLAAAGGCRGRHIQRWMNEHDEYPVSDALSGFRLVVSASRSSTSAGRIAAAGQGATAARTG